MIDAQQQPMQQQEQQPYMAPPPPMFSGHNTEGAIQYQVETGVIIEELEHSLKGEVLKVDEEGRPEWLKLDEWQPLINDYGLSRIMVIIRTRANKIYTLTSYNEEDIIRMTVDVGENVIDLIYTNWNEYEIKDAPSASMITDMVCDTVYAVAKKSHNSRFLRHIGSIQSINEVGQYRGQQSPEQSAEDSIMEGFIKRLTGRR